MLLNSLYSYQLLTRGEGVFSGLVIYEPGHPIFEGHFPEAPVVPGVTMMELVREVLEQESGRAWQLKEASVIKFLSMINPRDTPQVRLEISYSPEGQVSASLLNEGVVYFKFQGQFT